MAYNASPHCLPNYPPPVSCNLLTGPIISGIASFCNVTVSLTHPGVGETVYTTVLLPLSDWTHRYLATGGGGFAAGNDRDITDPVSQGWVASSTDGGLTLNHTIDPQTGAYTMWPEGSYNEEMVINLVYRSIHDAAEISKGLISQFYGQKASYLYHSGCSAGGRQGYASASYYPGDFDGILADAPALFAPEFAVAGFWPAIMMRNTEAPPFCVFEAYETAILESCNPLDGVRDGLISHPDVLSLCVFDTSSFVGKEIACPQLGTTKSFIITSTNAEITTKIPEGPIIPEGERLYHGVAPGVSFTGFANTTTFANGTSIPVPFRHSEPWINYETFFETMRLSSLRMASIYGNDVLNMTTFAAGKGKLLTWHGLADQMIPPLGMVDFREQIEAELGGSKAVNEWYQLFFAPGVGHCRGGYGPIPVEPLNALVKWVEKGKAPETLFAASVDETGYNITRELCLFPKKLVYVGGNVRDASSFECQYR
ncbi:Tannase/feruloyl esterase [Aspergillus crustosus]